MFLRDLWFPRFLGCSYIFETGKEGKIQKILTVSKVESGEAVCIGKVMNK